ncbi:hypothetical protein GCM10028805_32650 [Spirosoma harenae]
MKSTILLFFFFIVFIGLPSCRVQNHPPELIRVSPDTAGVSDNIRLTGYQFGTDPIVTFTSSVSVVTAPLKSHDETSINLTVPATTPGANQIRVQTNQGISDPLPFVVKQPGPQIASVDPTNGLQGTTVVIKGNFLNQLQRVRFNDVNAAIKDSTISQITVIVPAEAKRGSQPLVIETIGGTVSTPIPFIVAGTPQITSISPLRAKPGTELVIQGKNLTDAILSINGLTTDRSLTTVKDTEIRTIIPATATSGLVRVQVFERLVAFSTDTLKIIQPPFITNLAARDGIAGDKLIIQGLNLRDITSLSFGNVAATFRVLSDTQIEAVVPALAASGAVAVSANSIGGNATATDQFFFYLAPSNLVATPARQLSGRPITISGKNLYRITDVKINGITVPITSRNEGFDLLIGVPDNATSGPVTVSSRAGTASVPLVVVQKPTISTVLPAKARIGERIVLQGDFLQDASIYFTGSTTPAADGGKNTDTERWLLVPADAQTGPLRVVNVAGETTTTTSFTPIRLPTITDFTPKSGAIGTDITITGQNLSTVTAVRFSGGTSSTATFHIAGNSLIATVPANALTGQVCLTNEAGTICTSANFTVTK